MLFTRSTPNRLADAYVLITGAASGIGKALALEASRQGAKLRLADQDSQRLEQTVEALHRQGADVQGRTLDVTSASAVQDWIQGSRQRDGRIDYLFNNAGIGLTGEVRDMDVEAWNRILDVNLRGVIHGVQAVYPIMVEQGQGQIANIACIAGLVPFPMNAAYCASKHAIVGLSNALRGEAAPLGVGVSVICPGTIATDMFENNEYLKIDKQALLTRLRPTLIPADRCARQILRGVLANRSIITINLHAAVAWWSYRLAPRLTLGLMAATFGRVSQRLRLSNSEGRGTPPIDDSTSESSDGPPSQPTE